jgi:hypothetical protein
MRHGGRASPSVTAAITADAYRIRRASAVVQPSAVSASAAFPSKTAFSVAAPRGRVFVLANATTWTLHRGVATSAALCTVTADPITNAGSLDPASRTFYRPAMRTEFTRPAQIVDFRRVA